MKRLLFFYLGPYFMPTEIPVREYYQWLSKEYEGEIIAVVSRREFRRFDLGNFRLVGLYLPKWVRDRTLLRDLAFVSFVLTCVPFRHLWRNSYDVVICKEPLVTGVLAVLIGKMFGIRSVVEINGNFEHAFLVNDRRVSLMERVKSRYARIMIPLVVGRADGVKLVYPQQLSRLGIEVSPDKLYVFPNFVPVSRFCPSDEDRHYLLFCGYPWHLKGVDILIRAFQLISPEFPDYRLKIVGYCPDKAPYQKLAEGNPRIELCDPVWHEGIKELMQGCSLFVLPSRTEAMGRVLLEAMACGKPVIGSNVDGIPAVIKHESNGLLFESENVEDLAAKIRALLRDPALAKRLAENGLHHVHSALSEAAYLQRFSHMIEQVASCHAH